MDLALDSTGDLDITTDGDIYLTTGTDAVRQDLQIRLAFFQGEWFMDTRIGLPYFQQILGQKPRYAVLAQIYRKVIMSAALVTAIENLEFDWDGTTRTLDVSFNAVTVLGTVEVRMELII